MFETQNFNQNSNTDHYIGLPFGHNVGDCQPWYPDWYCRLQGWKTAADVAKENNVSVDQYYPTVILNDGNYTNFSNLKKVASIAAEDTAGYSSYDGKGKVIKQFNKGSSLGVAEVYYEGAPNLWIGFKKDSDGKQHNWVYVKDTTINAKEGYKKGLKNDKQIADEKAAQEEKDGKKFGDKFLESLQTGFKYMAIAGGVYLIANSFINKEEKKAVQALGKTKKSKKASKQNGRLLLGGLAVGLLIAANSKNNGK